MNTRVLPLISSIALVTLGALAIEAHAQTICRYDLTPSSGQPGTATVDITVNRFQIEFSNANPNTLYTIWADHRNRTTLQLADDYPLGEGRVTKGGRSSFRDDSRCNLWNGA